MIGLRWMAILIGVGCLGSWQLEGPQVSETNPPADSALGFDLSAPDRALVESISTSEWLGPLAPVAISPFFGVTCLAGISQFGPDMLPPNAFLANNPVLQSPAVFWIFLVLTLATSLPRFTKVSKPIAQALDGVEAYAGIITIIVLRFAVSPDAPPQTVAVQMGWLTFSADVLLSAVAVLNIIVINSVKFFFEILVWLIPVPFIDAALEVANKSLCFGLMALYAWSPWAAMIVNAVLFQSCLLAFNVVRRRVHFFRTMLIEPCWALIRPDAARPMSRPVTVFLRFAWGKFPVYTCLRLRWKQAGWEVTQPRWWWTDRSWTLEGSQYRAVLCGGLLVNTIRLEPLAASGLGDSGGRSNTEPLVLLVSRRYNDHFQELARQLNADLSRGTIAWSFPVSSAASLAVSETGAAPD